MNDQISRPMSERPMLLMASKVALLVWGLAPSFWKVQFGLINKLRLFFLFERLFRRKKAHGMTFSEVITIVITLLKVIPDHTRPYINGNLWTGLHLLFLVIWPKGFLTDIMHRVIRAYHLYAVALETVLLSLLLISEAVKTESV